jgi:protein TonB
MTPKSRHALALPGAACALVFLVSGAVAAAARQTPEEPAGRNAQGDGRARQESPLTKEFLLGALRGGSPTAAELVRLVKGRGVAFRATAEDESRLREAGATAELLKALRANYRPDATPDGVILLIPNPRPPATNPHLPTPSVIQADPLLIAPDTRAIPYGLPDSTQPSAGPGRGGGMGTGSGIGAGAGSAAAPREPVGAGGPIRKDELVRAQRTTGHDADALLRQVEQRGVNFRLSAADERALVAAGAPASLVAAGRGHNRAPVGRGELEEMLRADRSRATRADGGGVAGEIEKRGADFKATPKVINALRKAGASEAVLAALRANYRPAAGAAPPPAPDKPAGTPPRAEAKAPTPPPGSGVGTGSGVGVGGGGGYNIGGRGIGPGGAGLVDYTRAFRSGEVTVKAIIISKPEPGFTEEARKNNVTGVVRLRVMLHASGLVTNISVVRGLPDGLSEKAAAAARAISFRPAQKDGRTVSQWALLEYNFNIY